MPASRIRVMPPTLASQIAAGEVVERPASAVKELVENAIDAGATRCDVEIEGGGITRIRVVDDGRGMTPEDAALSVERHATSKLFSVEDLGNIATYGFRGEALPSIASVSRFSLRTRTGDGEAGVVVEVHGGHAATVRPIGVPVGTTVEIADLFFNVAPRRKFLRSAGTEAGHVADILEAAALSRPDLTFTLARDGRRVREWLRVDGRLERARSVFGIELAPCVGSRGPLVVEAFLSRPEQARVGATSLRLFVNGRPVRDRSLLYTVAQAYGSVLERGRYPRGVVYLDLPPALVDVNVHPQKAEVRFADPRAVTDAAYHLLSTELARAFALPTPSRSPGGLRSSAARPPGVVDGVATNSGTAQFPEVRNDDGTVRIDLSAARVDGSPVGPPAQGASLPGDLDGSAGVVASEAAGATDYPAADGAVRADGASSADSLVVRDSASQPAVRWTSLRFVAQLRQTYLVCEGHEGLYVIDQHAAAERVNFDRLRKQFRSRAVPAQALLFPITFQVTAEECELVEQKTAEFVALGVDVRVRGAEMLSVHSVPKLLHRASPERLVRDLLTELSRTGRRAFSDLVDLAIATMACHGSIRAGDPLSETEARALLSGLDYVDFAGHCPHGRPVLAFTSWSELERKVGRR